MVTMLSFIYLFICTYAHTPLKIIEGLCYVFFWLTISIAESIIPCLWARSEAVC